MFTFEQFDKLHSIWDGNATNVKEVCAPCGICCDLEIKSLFPNEYEYLESKTGQKNIYWAGKTCICNQLSVKSVICKLYPYMPVVDLYGYKLLRSDEGTLIIDKDYTDRCQLLKFDESKVIEFCSYLFSDIDNRIFWMFTMQLGEYIYKSKEYYESLGIHVKYAEVVMRAVLDMFNMTPYMKGDIIYEVRF